MSVCTHPFYLLLIYMPVAACCFAVQYVVAQVDAGIVRHSTSRQRGHYRRGSQPAGDYQQHSQCPSHWRSGNTSQCPSHWRSGNTFSLVNCWRIGATCHQKSTSAFCRASHFLSCTTFAQFYLSHSSICRSDCIVPTKFQWSHFRGWVCGGGMSSFRPISDYTLETMYDAHCYHERESYTSCFNC